ncbi:MAG: hypothetical protein F6K31_30505, partial [Symploca sp. SIO2G7]|nr:hypothetical protein [Symploca sp. SIO2G7]
MVQKLNKTAEANYMDFGSRRTIKQFLMAMGALGIVLTIHSHVFSAELVGQLTSFELTVSSRLVTKQKESASSEFARYESAKFSVDYPRGWQVFPQGDNGIAIISIADGVN